MKIKSGLLAIAVACMGSGAFAQASTEPVKIGFVTDMSGPFSDLDGPGGLSAIRMAVEDFGGKVLGRPIEILSADHQNKADIAANKARQWWDQDQVALVMAGSNSSASLAISNIAKDKQKVFISAGAGADSLTEEACHPYVVRYIYSTSAQARGTANALTQQGEKSWYFITVDFAFGHSLEAASMNVVKAAGGTVRGSVRHPLNASDFSSYLKAVEAAKTTDSDKVMAALKSIKIDDMFAKGYIRADGAMVHDMNLMQVKTRSESKRPWDYYRLVSKIPGEVAYAPKPGACYLLPKS